MKNSDTICINEIGPVLFERSRRAKHVTISVRASRGVRVAVPMRASFNKAMEFVHFKKKWIKKHLAIIERLESRKNASENHPEFIDRADARKKLAARLGKLADEHGFKYNKVSVREQRTRWGSCSHNNNISLNMKLVKLPDELMDYVLLHELVHTRIHNHSEKFWAELDRHVENSKVIAKELRMSDLSVL